MLRHLHALLSLPGELVALPQLSHLCTCAACSGGTHRWDWSRRALPFLSQAAAMSERGVEEGFAWKEPAQRKRAERVALISANAANAADVEVRCPALAFLQAIGMA